MAERKRGIPTPKLGAVAGEMMQRQAATNSGETNSEHVSVRTATEQVPDWLRAVEEHGKTVHVYKRYGPRPIGRKE